MPSTNVSIQTDLQERFRSPQVKQSLNMVNPLTQSRIKYNPTNLKQSNTKSKDLLIVQNGATSGQRHPSLEADLPMYDLLRNMQAKQSTKIFFNSSFAKNNMET